MSTNDTAIWRRWFPTVRSLFLRLWFDAELGDGKPVEGDFTTDELAFWKRETAKRADVIAETAKEMWLIELREAAQPNAIGRLLVYKHLYQQQPPSPKPLRLFLVTNIRDPATQAVAEQNGITYVVS